MQERFSTISTFTSNDTVIQNSARPTRSPQYHGATRIARSILCRCKVERSNPDFCTRFSRESVRRGREALKRAVPVASRRVCRGMCRAYAGCSGDAKLIHIGKRRPQKCPPKITHRPSWNKGCAALVCEKPASKAIYYVNQKVKGKDT